MKETLNSKLYILVVIGIVSAFGPFACVSSLKKYHF